MKPDYQEFAKELLSLCNKHGVVIRAENAGLTYIMPLSSTSMIGLDYDNFRVNVVPGRVELGRKYDDNYITLDSLEEGSND